MLETDVFRVLHKVYTRIYLYYLEKETFKKIYSSHHLLQRSTFASNNIRRNEEKTEYIIHESVCKLCTALASTMLAAVLIAKI